MSKSVAVLIRDSKRTYEGLRCSLGNLLEDHKVSMFVLNHEIKLTEEYYDNMNFIDEMGGTRYSNVKENIEKHGFTQVTLEEVAEKIRDNELVIPF